MRAYEVLSLEPHFDPDQRFRQYEADPITGAPPPPSVALYVSAVCNPHNPLSLCTGKTVLRLIDITVPTRDLAAVLRSSKVGADIPTPAPTKYPVQI
jgi:hypothetical protein